jgi:hypothetical protein
MNSMQPSSGNPGSHSFAVTTASPYCFTTIDNNDYFVNGVGPNIGYLNGNKPILEMWQSATGQDANSMNVNPLFVSPSDFHPTNSALNNKGTYIAVHRDIAGALRTNPPDPGVFEFGTDPQVVTGEAAQVGPEQATLSGMVTAANEFVTTHFDYGASSGYGSSVAATPSMISGNNPTGISCNLASLLPGTTYHFRARGVTVTGLTIYGEDATFTTTNSIPVNITVLGTISGDTCFNASQTITVGGTPDTFHVSATGSATLIAGQNILLLPGTTVQEGGYLHGYISTEYCETTDVPATPAKPEIAGNNKSGAEGSSNSLFRVYPNPTTGTFTLELQKEIHEGNTQVELFSMQGARIFSGELSGTLKYELSLSAQPLGIYLIRVTTGGTTESARIIRQ